MPDAMPAELDREAAHTASILRAIGYGVKHLPVSDQQHVRSCDLAATAGDERLLVEVKVVQPSSEVGTRLRRSESVLFEGEIAQDRRVRAKLTYGAVQTAAVASRDGPGLQLVWVRIHGPGEDLRSLRIFSTLFGVRYFQIVQGPCLRGVNVVPCYLADTRPWFAGHQEVCAIVVESAGAVSLHINPFSPERENVMRTRLFRTLNDARAVFDIDVYRGPFGLYVADPTASTEAAVISSLFETYGITVIPIQVEAMSTAWPGNEMGMRPGLPGADVFVPVWDLLYRLHQESRAPARITDS